MTLFSKKVAAKAMSTHFPALGSTLHFDVPTSHPYWVVRLVAEPRRVLGGVTSGQTLKTWEVAYEREALRKFSDVEAMLSILEALEGRRVQ
jgi:hypothetical protein